MAIQLLPDLSTKCSPIPGGVGELCIQLPGGAQICASLGLESGDAATIVSGLLAQLNTALGPLQPFFNILDFVIAVFDCINAIPESLLSLNPQPIVECIQKLTKAVDKLIGLVPQLSVPILIKTSLDVIIEGIIGVRIKLEALMVHATKVDTAENVAATTGNVQLGRVAQCARDNLDAQLANINAAFAPLNRLISLLNILLELAKLPCIPSLAAIPAVDSSGLAALDAVIEVLEVAKMVIPGPGLALPPLGVPGECA